MLFILCKVNHRKKCVSRDLKDLEIKNGRKIIRNNQIKIQFNLL